MTIFRLSLLVFIVLTQPIVACDKGKEEESDEPSPRPQVSTEESFATGLGSEEEQGTMFRPPQVSAEESTDITEQIIKIMAASSDSRSEESSPMNTVSHPNLEMREILQAASVHSLNVDAPVYSIQTNSNSRLQQQLRMLEGEGCLVPGKVYRLSVNITPPKRKVSSPMVREASEEMTEVPFAAIKANSYSERSSLVAARNQGKELKKNSSDSAIRRSVGTLQSAVMGPQKRDERDLTCVSFDTDLESLPSPRESSTKKVWSPRKEAELYFRSKITSPRTNKPDHNTEDPVLAPKSSSLNSTWNKYKKRKKEKELRRTLSDTSVKKKAERPAVPSSSEKKNSPRYLTLKPRSDGGSSSSSSRTSPRGKDSPKSASWWSKIIWGNKKGSGGKQEE